MPQVLEKNFPLDQPMYLIPIHRENHWACAVVLAPITPKLGFSRENKAKGNQSTLLFKAIEFPRIFFFDSALQISPEIS